jgi:hypothetical protein
MNASSCPSALRQAPSSSAARFLATKEKVSESELEEVIDAWVGAGVPASLLLRHLLDYDVDKEEEEEDEDDLKPDNSVSTCATVADDVVLEKLLAFLLVKGDEYRKDHKLVNEAPSSKNMNQQRHDASFKHPNTATTTTTTTTLAGSSTAVPKSKMAQSACSMMWYSSNGCQEAENLHQLQLLLHSAV